MVLNIINWDVDPEIFKIFNTISIRYYSIFFVTGLLMGYHIVKKIYLKENMPLEHLEKLSMYIFIGTIAGARLGHCIFYDPSYYFAHPLEMFLPFQGTIGKDFQFTGYQGLASHGGAIGVLLAIFIFSRKTKSDIWTILDNIAIAVPVTGAFIRLGNLMNSEIIGHVTDVPWAFAFKRIDGLPRHPTQLYEAISYVLIFVIIQVISKKYAQYYKSGFTFGLFLILLFSARFIIEFFKISQESFENDLLFNMGQLLSLPFIISGIIIVFRTYKKT